MYVITFLQSNFVRFLCGQNNEEAKAINGKKVDYLLVLFWWSLGNNPSKTNEMFAKFKRNFCILFLWPTTIETSLCTVKIL